MIALAITAAWWLASAYAQLSYSPALLIFTVLAMALVFVTVAAALLASGAARACGLASWALMAAAFQPTLRDYKVSPLWGFALPAIAALYAFYTVEIRARVCERPRRALEGALSGARRPALIEARRLGRCGLATVPDRGLRVIVFGRRRADHGEFRGEQPGQRPWLQRRRYGDSAAVCPKPKMRVPGDFPKVAVGIGDLPHQTGQPAQRAGQRRHPHAHRSTVDRRGQAVQLGAKRAKRPPQTRIEVVGARGQLCKPIFGDDQFSNEVDQGIDPRRIDAQCSRREIGSRLIGGRSLRDRLGAIGVLAGIGKIDLIGHQPENAADFLNRRGD